MGYALVWLINTIISLMIWFIIAQAILSWLVAFDVVNYRNRFVYSVGTFLDRVTAPLLEPFRRIIPNLGGIDISPIVGGLDGGGAVTFIVGTVTGAALGASSDVIALSIAAGVIKSIAIMIVTPLVAKAAGLNSPAAAIVYGGLMGSTSGVAAGLAATDPKLVPYGAMTATFYTGLGCLLAPSALYISLAPFF